MAHVETKLERIYARILSPLPVAGLLLLLLMGGLVHQMAQLRLAKIEAAEAASRSLASLFEVRIANDFQRLDGLLSFVASEFLPDRMAYLPPVERAEQSARLARLIDNFPAVAGFYIFNAEGDLQLASDLATQPFSIADRPHFQAVRDEPHLNSVFTDPLMARSTGRLAIVQSRAIRDASGHFLGVVNAIYHLETLAEQIASIDVGPGGVTLLRRSDNFNLIARHPRGNEADFGKGIPENNPIRQKISAGMQQGFLDYVASTDGIRRIGSFRVLEQYPFYVQVAFAESDYLADWQREAVRLAVVFLVLGIPVLLVLLRLKRARIRELAAANALQAQQRRLEKISHNIPGAIYQFQRWPDGHVAFPYASEGIREIYGLAPEAVREDASPVYAVLHPDDQGRVAQRIEESAATLANWYDEYRVSLPGGRLLWVEGEATPERLADGSVLWHGHIRDVTHRKEVEQRIRDSEQRFRDYSMASSDWFWEMDADLRFSFFSDRAEATLGVSPQRLLGCRREEIADPEDILREDWRAHLSILEQHQPFRHFEYQVRTDLGGRWFSISGVPVFDDQGNFKGYRGIGSDISARKNAEGVLLEAKQAAEAANVAKSRFLATMSHEIRTPMNGILGMAQMLLRADIDYAERQDFARTILNSGQTLLTLLNDILDYSKVEAGKMGLERAAFAPEQLLREVQSLYAETARGQGVQLSAVWHGEDVAYFSDPHRLQQMLSNLVGNALKFTARGKISVEAKEIWRDGKTGWLEFSVSDTGVGIPADKQQLLFKPFCQADSSTTRQFGGTGLGLSIVKTLAELMGGEVGVDSQPGQGARFWFQVRAEVVDADERRQHERLAGALLADDDEASNAAPPPQCKVLVVEDDPTNQKVIRAMLDGFGSSYVIANDGQQAVDCIAAGGVFDLILMDLQMPIMDGIGATTSIRQREKERNEPRRIIIALTADAFAEDRQRCLDAGMDDFLTKPIDVNALAHMLRQWLARQVSPAADSADSAVVQMPVLATAQTRMSFDESALLKPLGNNRKLARIVIASAMEDIPKYLAQLEQACGVADWREAARRTHTMKGLAGQIGGMELARLLRETEDRLKAGEPLSPEGLAHLQTEYAALANTLQHWLES